MQRAKRAVGLVVAIGLFLSTLAFGQQPKAVYAGEPTPTPTTTNGMGGGGHTGG